MDNILLNEKEIEENRTVLKSRPHRLMIMLTTECNLQCIMCYRVKALKHQTIPFEVIEKVYDLLPYITWMNWQGGEVFLVNYFKQLFFKICNNRHIYQTILTNGLLIDDDWAKILTEFNVGVTYSIDAVTKETYENIRRGSRFSDLLKSIERMDKYKSQLNSPARLGITAVVMKSNYRELHLFPEFCKKFGFLNMRLDYLHPEVIPEEDIILCRDPAALDYLKDIVLEIEKKCEELGIGFSYTFKELLTDDTNKEKTKEDNASSRVFPNCKLPWQQLTILATEKGDVQPDCACIHPVGNLFDHTVEQIWNNEKMQLYRKNLIAGNLKNFCGRTCLINMGMSN